MPIHDIATRCRRRIVPSAAAASEQDGIASPVDWAILADYPVYFKPRVFQEEFFSLNSCKMVSERHVFAMTGKMEIVKRSVRIAGHATSISLEPAFWDALCEIAARRSLSLNALLSEIDAGRSGNLSSAIRLFVLASYRTGKLGAAAEA